jgi:hypothetical protein
VNGERKIRMRIKRYVMGKCLLMLVGMSVFFMGCGSESGELAKHITVSVPPVVESLFIRKPFCKS